LIKLSCPAVGVAILDKEPSKGEEYQGISFCDALRRATLGEALVLRSGSIDTCRWSPPVLGLKGPETDFEKGLSPRLEKGHGGVFLARVSDWPLSGKPDVVVIRADREEFGKLVELVPASRLYGLDEGIDKTAVPLFFRERSLRSGLIGFSNRLLERLGRYSLWNDFTVWAFRREWTSRVLNLVLDRSMANMSMCRNSTVIPYLTGRLNVSHFCTGGISWGRNSPHLLTGGMPYDLYAQFADEFEVKKG